MKLQTGGCRPLLHLRQRSLGLFSATAQNHEVISVPHHLITYLFTVSGTFGEGFPWTHVRAGQAT